MSKIMIVGDTHFKKIDSELEKKYRNKVIGFLSKTIKKYKVKSIYHLGDWFDTRRSVDISVVEDNIEISKRLAVPIISIAGNHDVYYKNVNDICSTKVLLEGKKFKAITEPTEKGNCLFLPWINKNNYEDSIDVIQNSKADYCFGHLEINGFNKVRGFAETSGFKPSEFKKFKRVFSGHFHLVQDDKNISYVGSLFQNDFNDVNDIKRLFIFDDISGKIEEIKIPIEFYKKIVITDNFDKSIIEKENLNECRFKIILNCKKSIKRENFIDDIESYVTHSEYKIIDNSQLLEEENVVINTSENINDMFLDYVDSIEEDETEKEELKKLFMEASNESNI